MKINMLTASYLEFERDFLRFYNGIEPLYALVDTLARHMDANQSASFKLPAHAAKDGRGHTFYFKVVKGQYEYDYAE